MKALETYYIGLDEAEADMMSRIVDMSRAIDTMTKERDGLMKTFLEVFGPIEEEAVV